MKNSKLRGLSLLSHQPCRRRLTGISTAPSCVTRTGFLCNWTSWLNEWVNEREDKGNGEMDKRGNGTQERAFLTFFRPYPLSILPYPVFPFRLFPIYPFPPFFREFSEVTYAHAICTLNQRCR